MARLKVAPPSAGAGRLQRAVDSSPLFVRARFWGELAWQRAELARQRAEALAAAGDFKGACAQMETYQREAQTALELFKLARRALRDEQRRLRRGVPRSRGSCTPSSSSPRRGRERCARACARRTRRSTTRRSGDDECCAEGEPPPAGFNIPAGFKVDFSSLRRLAFYLTTIEAHRRRSYSNRIRAKVLPRRWVASC